MAGAPAYRYDSYSYAETQPRPSYRPEINVIPGQGPVKTISPAVTLVIRVIVAVFIIMLVAGGVRVYLDSTAVSTSMANDQLAMDLNTVRAQGSELEIQASNLSNPAYVRDYAKSKLGMAAPTTVETMSLGEDVVVVDESGALSLSGSLSAIARR